MIQVNAVLPSPGLADSSLGLRFNLRTRDISLGRRPLSLYFQCPYSVGNPHPGETKIQAQRINYPCTSTYRSLFSKRDKLFISVLI